MKLVSTIILASAMVAAAPSQDIPSLDGPGPRFLSKRDSYHCGLTNYAAPTEGPIGDGIAYLIRGGSNAKCSNAHQCELVSCSYGTGIAICAGSSQYCINSDDIGDAVKAIYSYCGYHGFNGGTSIPAMQVFQQNGNNVLVKGGYRC
ncbi:hypothetical protein F4677DRAFT_448414 [Hypoxylon crocopeplum]|nr:hypothetical protein F4677DRAFT_448414 [Hypoxylon crocopeplum]